MNTVWLDDLIAALQTFKEEYPDRQWIGGIHGNAFGDFIVLSEPRNFCIDHKTYEIVEIPNWKIPNCKKPE